MIELINNLVVKVDQYNYALSLRTDKKDKEGNIVYKPISYHDNLKNAIRGAKDYTIKNELKEGIRDLETAIKEINRIDREFEELLIKVLESEEI